MTDAEESLLWLGVQLRDGVQDMLDHGRLRFADIPDDNKWLALCLNEMARLCQQVRAEDDR